MPSSRIHATSVTKSGPVSNCTRTAIESPSVASAPATYAARAQRPGSRAPSSADAAGSQMRIERCTSARLDQEVEGEARESEQHQRRVEAQVPRLDGAHRRAARPNDPRGAADERAVDEHALERRLGEAPGRRERAHDDRVDDLVEVPLVQEELVGPTRPRA